MHHNGDHQHYDDHQNRIQRISLKLLNRLTVCQPVEMKPAKGDQLQLKANAPSPDGKELVNGELVTVASVNSKGQIQLKDGRTLPENYREFVRGYAITSYGSQGKPSNTFCFPIRR